MSQTSTRAICGPYPAAHRIRLLLINPRFPESFWSFHWAVSRVLPGKRALNPPLGLATVAALCPPDWEVQIVDENVETLPLKPGVDLVGICGMGVQFARQRELLAYYRDRGYYVVAGGSYASLCPERYARLADTVIAGEAEYIWPRFCRDFEQGRPEALYRETGVVDLADSPVPRFDLLKLDRYTTISMQFSRGCPYQCEFCDIIVMFGRRPRTKSPGQIGRELDLLRALGVRNVFFVDDNLIGHKSKARELMVYLRDYQRQHGYRFSFGTEVSLNLADDEELLALFRAANFGWVFIGIETPDPASLKETRKTQNLRRDLLEAVRTLYRNGIDVLSGFIVGFDNDTFATFERQRQFITDSGIQVAMVGLLTALPKTPLYERLRREGRLIAGAQDGDNTRAGTNFVPLRMSYAEMVAGYKALYRKLLGDAGIARRILAKVRYLRSPVGRSRYRISERLLIPANLLFKGILRGGAIRTAWFVRTLLAAPIRAWPQVIADWIAGLSMRDYAERHIVPPSARERNVMAATLKRLRRQCREYLRRGALSLSVLPRGAAASLCLTLRGRLDGRLFEGLSRRLEYLLARSAATVTLHVEALAEEQRRGFERLLARLACYGDRVAIRVREELLARLSIDSSVFHLMLSEQDACPGTQAGYCA